MPVFYKKVNISTYSLCEVGFCTFCSSIISSTNKVLEHFKNVKCSLQLCKGCQHIFYGMLKWKNERIRTSFHFVEIRRQFNHSCTFISTSRKKKKNVGWVLCCFSEEEVEARDWKNFVEMLVMMMTIMIKTIAALLLSF